MAPAQKSGENENHAEIIVKILRDVVSCAALCGFVHSNPFQLSFIPQNKRGNNNLKMSKSFHLDRSDPGRAKLSPDCSFELGGAVGPAAEAEPNKGIRGSHPRTSVDDTGGSGLETALGLV